MASRPPRWTADTEVGEASNVNGEERPATDAPCLGLVLDTRVLAAAPSPPVESGILGPIQEGVLLRIGGVTDTRVPPCAVPGETGG